MNTTSFEDLRSKVVQWACDRQITDYATPQGQLLKTVEEVGELAAGLARGDGGKVQDAVGDILVCLINFCEILRIDPVYCLSIAYDQIKDRKGFMTEYGIFVKEDEAADEL